jgi:hypothetical protein
LWVQEHYEPVYHTLTSGYLRLYGISSAVLTYRNQSKWNTGKREKFWGGVSWKWEEMTVKQSSLRSAFREKVRRDEAFAYLGMDMFVSITSNASPLHNMVKMLFLGFFKKLNNYGLYNLTTVNFNPPPVNWGIGGKVAECLIFVIYEKACCGEEQSDEAISVRYSIVSSVKRSFRSCSHFIVLVCKNFFFMQVF